jgi:putative phosphoribosyl transferase
MLGQLKLGRQSHFQDRCEGGRALAELLSDYRTMDAIVLGIPRGGLPVAAEVAKALGVHLDVIAARKVGAPDNPEFAIGAVTANGGQFLDPYSTRLVGASAAYLQAAIQAEVREARRRETVYRGKRPAPVLKGRTVIVVDDGLATGATMRAAVRSVRKQEPTRVVAAVPVASREACETLRAEADAVVCCGILPRFIAVGAHYDQFDQVSDQEVIDILADRLAKAA